MDDKNGTLKGLHDLLLKASQGKNIHEAPKDDKQENEETFLKTGMSSAPKPSAQEAEENMLTGKGYAGGGDVSAALGQLAAPFNFLGAPAQMAGSMATNPAVQGAMGQAINSMIPGSNPIPQNQMPPTPPPPQTDPAFMASLNAGTAMTPSAPPAPQPGPSMGQVSQSAQSMPSTNPSIYQGITAEDRAALMQKLIAQKSSPGMLAASGAAGLGDAITSAFGKSPTNAQGNLRQAEQQNMEQRTGAMDTQRQQKIQDVQANMMQMKNDPKSSMSNMARQMYKGLTGKIAPRGVSAAQLESVMPLIEKNLEGSVQQAIATGAQGVEAAKTKYGETWGQMFKDVFSPSGETSGEAGLTAAQNKAFPGTGAPAASTSQFKYVGKVK